MKFTPGHIACNRGWKLGYKRYKVRSVGRPAVERRRKRNGGDSRWRLQAQAAVGAMTDHPN